MLVDDDNERERDPGDGEGERRGETEGKEKGRKMRNGGGEEERRITGGTMKGKRGEPTQGEHAGTGDYYYYAPAWNEIVIPSV